MKARDIRQKFLDFYASKNHTVVGSAPMVIKNDPTLMFTNAGMNQFKDIFLGNSEVKFPRAVNSQKCLRVSGKHNDLEEVGVDTYHHTMFEMLGNWSFGDYFKKEAIEWAWELLTEVYKIDKDKLYVTIFEGDASENLEEDKEAAEIWAKILPAKQILKGNKQDNFWEMGETGPCGPCSEIHIDLRSDEERAKVDGASLVNMDHPQVMEIWNLVFMELNRSKDRSLRPLPAKHIDTGMGFERLAVVLQGKSSNYDTDVFTGLLAKIEARSGKKYLGTDSKADIAMRVVADHVRAVAFSIADGQLPSNNKAGYVIRRILRRAIRYAYSVLGIDAPFIYTLVEVLAEELGDFFPELTAQKELIGKVIHEEEENFLRTLGNGIQRLDEIVKNTDGDTIDGKVVFELYDTYGFPVDLTALIAADAKMNIDEEGFNAQLTKQKERSRAAGKVDTGDWVIIQEDEREEFIGYDRLKADVLITKYREVTAKGKKGYQLVFNFTPFFAEGGGQVGDSGWLTNGDDKIRIINTKRENNNGIHFADKLPKYISEKYHAEVEEDKRKKTTYNHTATHLLHQGLRNILGTHVEQKGSLVNEKHLRFDFSHYSKVSEEELKQVEVFVNQQIRNNHDLEENRRVPIEDAKKMGAIMLFGEKYSDLVRVIKFGDSMELCGGTHVNTTAEIGQFKILHESSVAAGVRRIEAITASTAQSYIDDQLQVVGELKTLLKEQNNILKAVQDLMDKNASLSKSLEKFKKEKAQNVKEALNQKLKLIGDVKFLAERVSISAGDVKDIAFQFRASEERVFGVLASDFEGKPTITCFMSDILVKEKGLNAGLIVRELAKHIQGGGGGQAFFATAGGKKLEGIENALNAAESYLS